jgi:hypothetical protein
VREHGDTVHVFSAHDPTELERLRAAAASSSDLAPRPTSVLA